MRSQTEGAKKALLRPGQGYVAMPGNTILVPLVKNVVGLNESCYSKFNTEQRFLDAEPQHEAKKWINENTILGFSLHPGLEKE